MVFENDWTRMANRATKLQKLAQRLVDVVGFHADEDGFLKCTACDSAYRDLHAFLNAISAEDRKEAAPLQALVEAMEWLLQHHFLTRKVGGLTNPAAEAPVVYAQTVLSRIYGDDHKETKAEAIEGSE